LGRFPLNPTKLVEVEVDTHLLPEVNTETMDRDDLVYMAKLAEQAERYVTSYL